MIEKRINRLSKNEKIFNNSISTYQSALNDSNFKHKLKYSENNNPPAKKKTNRPRKIIYFNPPFCQSVKTNIEKYFSNLLINISKTTKHLTK